VIPTSALRKAGQDLQMENFIFYGSKLFGLLLEAAAMETLPSAAGHTIKIKFLGNI